MNCWHPPPHNSNALQIGREKGGGAVRVKVNPKFYRPTEVEQLLGDPTKAKTKLGWEPKVRLKY